MVFLKRCQFGTRIPVGTNVVIVVVVVVVVVAVARWELETPRVGLASAVEVLVVVATTVGGSGVAVKLLESYFSKLKEPISKFLVVVVVVVVASWELDNVRVRVISAVKVLDDVATTVGGSGVAVKLIGK